MRGHKRGSSEPARNKKESDEQEGRRKWRTGTAMACDVSK